MQKKVREQPRESIVSKQIEIESECIRKKRKNDQIWRIKRLVENVGINIFARLYGWVPGGE